MFSVYPSPLWWIWENIYIYMSYYHHQIGSMNYSPLFSVRSWNNGMCCMSLYILINHNFSQRITTKSFVLERFFNCHCLAASLAKSLLAHAIKMMTPFVHDLICLWYTYLNISVLGLCGHVTNVRMFVSTSIKFFNHTQSNESRSFIHTNISISTRYVTVTAITEATEQTTTH